MIIPFELRRIFKSGGKTWKSKDYSKTFTTEVSEEIRSENCRDNFPSDEANQKFYIFIYFESMLTSRTTILEEGE